jgi:O-acetyl-ADP-ribose deacetylase (regulator of RNase III)
VSGSAPKPFDRITLQIGDITTDREADAIVNAANSGLRGGGGVDGAIHRAAGPTLLAECQLLGGCETGEAKITGAGLLHARHVIHAVGPIWRGGRSGETALLASCYTRAIALAGAHDCRIVALPAISTGVYGYPVELAAEVSLTATAQALAESRSVTQARFWLFDSATYDVFARVLAEVRAS